MKLMKNLKTQVQYRILTLDSLLQSSHFSLLDQDQAPMHLIDHILSRITRVTVKKKMLPQKKQKAQLDLDQQRCQKKKNGRASLIGILLSQNPAARRSTLLSSQKKN